MVDVITDKAVEEINKIIGKVVLKTLGHIQKETPVDTGNLRNSIKAEKTADGWTIGTAVEYAEDVEYGTEPHIITPKNKKALRFEVGRKARLAAGKSPKDGKFVFAKKVNHPGTDGHHMFLKGVNYFEREIKKELTK